MIWFLLVQSKLNITEYSILEVCQFETEHDKATNCIVIKENFIQLSALKENSGTKCFSNVINNLILFFLKAGISEVDFKENNISFTTLKHINNTLEKDGLCNR